MAPDLRLRPDSAPAPQASDPPRPPSIGPSRGRKNFGAPALARAKSPHRAPAVFALRAPVGTSAGSRHSALRIAINED